MQMESPMAAERRGPGRWCAVRSPKGVLWESATGVGFDPVPGEDGSIMAQRIEEFGKYAFDQLASVYGERVTEGDLDHWTPTRKARR